MASSPEQEIPQEVVKRAYSAWYASERKEGATVWNSMRAALAAVLPDLQRPLLEEIARLRTAYKERGSFIEGLSKLQARTEAERDARPDLTPADTRALLDGWMAHSNLPFCPDPECDAKGCIEARRMRDEIKRKLERSLDAHKP